MMRKKRKEYSSEEMAQAVIELLSGDKMLSEVAAAYDVVPRTLEMWRKEFLEQAHRAFTTSKDEKALVQAKTEAEARESELMQKVGQLTMELDWCKKKVTESEHRRQKASSARSRGPV